MRGRCRRNGSSFRARKTQKPSAAQEIVCSREADGTNQSEEASEQMEAKSARKGAEWRMVVGEGRGFRRAPFLHMSGLMSRVFK